MKHEYDIMAFLALKTRYALGIDSIERDAIKSILIDGDGKFSRILNGHFAELRREQIRCWEYANVSELAKRFDDYRILPDGIQQPLFFTHNDPNSPKEGDYPQDNANFARCWRIRANCNLYHLLQGYPPATFDGLQELVVKHRLMHEGVLWDKFLAPNSGRALMVELVKKTGQRCGRNLVKINEWP